MAFDAVVYGEVKKIAREIGELALVPSNFSSPNYIDTGTFIDASAFPKLAERFVGIPHASELERKALPTVPMVNNVSTSVTLQGLGSPYRKAMVDANGYTYVVDTFFRVFRISQDATSVVYLGSTTGLIASNIYSFTSIGNKFIAFSASTVYVSTDALDWTIIKTPITPAALHRAGDFLFVFGTTTATAYITSDCVNWTAVTMPSAVTWSQVLHNGTCYFAYVIGTSTGARSTDGISWTSVTLPAAIGTNSAVSGNTFLLPSSAASVTAYTSTDGSTWTANSMPASASWFFTGNNAGFVAISGSAFFKSTTGLTGSWTTLSLPGTASQADIQGYLRPAHGSLWHMFTVGNSRLSLDAGVTWLPMPLVTAPSTSNVKALCGTTACTMYIDAFNNSLWKTTDSGNTWSEIVLPSGFVPNLLGYIPKTNTFIVVGPTFAGGYITSTDAGASWSAVTTFPITGYVTVPGCISVDIGRNKFAVIYATGVSSYTFIYTEDGVAWKAGCNISSSNFTTQPGRAVFFKDRFIAFAANHPSVAANNSIVVSSISNSVSPSVTYSTITAAAISASITNSNGIRGIASDNNTVVMVLGATSTAGLPGSNIIYSRDGYNWSTANLNGFTSFWDNVVWTGKFFVATQQVPINGVLSNSMSIAVSYDGMNWEIVNLGDFLDASDYANIPRALQVFSNASDDIYIAVANVKALFKVSNQARPRVDFIPTGINGTKYVVKAK